MLPNCLLLNLVCRDCEAALITPKPQTQTALDESLVSIPLATLIFVKNMLFYSCVMIVVWLCTYTIYCKLFYAACENHSRHVSTGSFAGIHLGALCRISVAFCAAFLPQHAAQYFPGNT